MTPLLQEAIKDNPSQLDKVNEWVSTHAIPTTT